MKQFFKGTGLAIGLLIAVYVPAFLITALVRPTIAVAIPLVIVISFGVSLAIMIALARQPWGLAEFGFRLPQGKYVWWCLGIGAVLGFVAGYATYLFPAKPPYDVSKLAPLVLVLYFVVSASIQEETIFRGLVQTIVARFFTQNIKLFGFAVGSEVAIVAVLFCLIHIPEGPAVGVGALALGLVAGEFRRRSESLIPAILVHTLFNISSGIFEFLPRFAH